MNLFQQIGIGAVVGFGAAAFAQSPSPGNTSAQAANAQAATSQPAPSPSPTAPVEPPSLIPPNILPGSGAGSLPQVPAAPDLQMLNSLFKQSSLGKAGDEHRLHLQMARLEDEIRNDADLQAEHARANRAPTDLGKRFRLKDYYHHYYNKLRMRAETPELKAYLDAQESLHLAILAQPRVRHDTNPGPARPATTLPTPVQARVDAGTIRP